MTVAVVLDACVLYPLRIRDLLLDIALELDLYQPKWSPEILDEMEANLIGNGVKSALAGKRLRIALNEVFPDAEVTGYEAVVASVAVHPKDRHVLAAAIHGNAGILVTDNLKDFPAEACDEAGVRIYSADHFLTRCFDIHPEVGRVVRGVHRRYTKARPELTFDEFVSRLFLTAPTFTSRIIEADEAAGAGRPAHREVS